MTANGAVPLSDLTVVQGAIELADDAAADYLAMRAAAIAARQSMSIALPAGGYRSLATQRAMIANPAAFNITKGIAIAAAGSSTHGLGECVDIVPATAVAWIEAHGGAFGFTRRASNDPNCFKHTPGTHAHITPASTGVATTVNRKKKTMEILFIRTPEGAIAGVVTLNGKQVKSPLALADWEKWASLGYYYLQVSDATYNAIPNA